MKLVLLRHGQSTWNKENRFTGWTDVDLSEEGVQEAKLAGKLLREEGIEFGKTYTSWLKRAIRTLWFVLEELDAYWLPTTKAWELNERHYGALQGLDKKETVQKHGEEQVKLWRRSYRTPPPPLTPDDKRYPGHERRYQSLDRGRLPLTESLADTVARVLPYWEAQIVPALKIGAPILVVAHGNSLRALVKHLDQLSDEAIVELNIPTGIPLLYELDTELKVRAKRYLGDHALAEQRAKAVAGEIK